MKRDGFLTKMRHLEKKIKDAHEEKKALLRRVAEECSPVKIGDVVEVNGYSHEGKKIVVESVEAGRRFGFDGFRIIVKGSVLKKNGEAGKNTAESVYEPVWDQE